MKTTSRKCTGNCGRFPTRLNLGFPIQHMSAAHSRGFTRGLLFGCPLPEDCRDSEEGEANSGVQVMRLSMSDLKNLPSFNLRKKGVPVGVIEWIGDLDHFSSLLECGFKWKGYHLSGVIGGSLLI
jgi:hypothetical protein